MARNRYMSARPWTNLDGREEQYFSALGKRALQYVMFLFQTNFEYKSGL
jgi:hypothetical protein